MGRGVCGGAPCTVMHCWGEGLPSGVQGGIAEDGCGCGASVLCGVPRGSVRTARHRGVQRAWSRLCRGEGEEISPFFKLPLCVLIPSPPVSNRTRLAVAAPPSLLRFPGKFSLASLISIIPGERLRLERPSLIGRAASPFPGRAQKRRKKVGGGRSMGEATDPLIHREPFSLPETSIFPFPGAQGTRIISRCT